MDHLFLLAAHNTVVAMVLAALVVGVTHLWRQPPVAHVLWLLVLLKLVAPPILNVGRPELWQPPSSSAPGQAVDGVTGAEGKEMGPFGRLVDRPTVFVTAKSSPTRDSTAGIRWAWDRSRPFLLGIWLGGAALYGLVAVTRVVRLERFLRGTLPASGRLQQLANDVAGRLGLRRVPDVRLVESVDVPFLWCGGGRPTIVLPTRWLTQIDEQGLALVLAHELAHFRRRDHWVRGLELVVSAVYWWNPLVGAIRRRIHHAEDLCCDAWVRWAFPGCAKRYAELLLKAAESLDVSQQASTRRLPVSLFLSPLSLKARIEMILEGEFAPGISRRWMVVSAVLAALVLPSSVRIAGSEARAGSSDGAQAAPTAGKSEAPRTSEFPHAVRFERGASRSLDGDEIKVLEVRGTADTFRPGHLYWIKGTYKLASHDRAKLAAFTTAKDAKNGRSSSFEVQMTEVERGEGTFTLFLPMTYRGWPHVSFYPAENGESFGTHCYFGTGDSVLKRGWWDKEAK